MALHIGISASGKLAFASETGFFRILWICRSLASGIRLFCSIGILIFVFVIVLVFVVITGGAGGHYSSGGGPQVAGQCWPNGRSEGWSSWRNCWTPGRSYCWSPGGLLGGWRSWRGGGSTELLVSEPVVPGLFPGLFPGWLGGWLPGLCRRGLSRGRHVVVVVVRFEVPPDGAVVLSVDAVVELCGEAAVDPVVGGADAGGLAEDGPVGADEADEGHLVVHPGDAHMVHLAVDFGIGVIFADCPVCARKAGFGNLVDVNTWRLAFRSLKNIIRCLL